MLRLLERDASELVARSLREIMRARRTGIDDRVDDNAVVFLRMEIEGLVQAAGECRGGEQQEQRGNGEQTM